MATLEETLNTVLKERGVRIDSGVILLVKDLEEKGIRSDDIPPVVSNLKQTLYVLDTKEGTGMTLKPNAQAKYLSASEYSIFESQYRHFWDTKNPRNPDVMVGYA